jgi:hypothetical protein
MLSSLPSELQKGGRVRPCPTYLQEGKKQLRQGSEKSEIQKMDTVVATERALVVKQHTFPMIVWSDRYKKRHSTNILCLGVRCIVSASSMRACFHVTNVLHTVSAPPFAY